MLHHKAEERAVFLAREKLKKYFDIWGNTGRYKGNSWLAVSWAQTLKTGETAGCVINVYTWNSQQESEYICKCWTFAKFLMNLWWIYSKETNEGIWMYIADLLSHYYLYLFHFYMWSCEKKKKSKASLYLSIFIQLIPVEAVSVSNSTTMLPSLK